MKTIYFKILGIQKQYSTEPEDFGFWNKSEILLEGGIFITSIYDISDEDINLETHVSLSSKLNSESHNSEKFQEGTYKRFPIICTLVTDKGNLATVFRVGNTLLTSYEVDGVRYIKDDALWALSNLDIKIEKR